MFPVWDFWANASLLGPQLLQWDSFLRFPFSFSGLAEQGPQRPQLQNRGHDKVLQKARNKLMHALKGNTTTLPLASLVPEQPTKQNQVLRLDWLGSELVAFTGPQLTRHFLLACRPPKTPTPPLICLGSSSDSWITTQLGNSPSPPLKGKRSGRRSEKFSPALHTKTFYRKRKKKTYRRKHRIHRIKRIQTKLDSCRAPPSRGVPEAHFGANKEGPPNGGGKQSPAQGLQQTERAACSLPGVEKGLCATREKAGGRR